MSKTLLCCAQLLSHVQLFATTIQSMVFSRPEYQRGQPFPPTGDLPNPGIKPRSPALQADSLPAELPGKPNIKHQFSSVQSLSRVRLFVTHGLYSPWNSPGQNTGGSAGKESACSAGDLGLIPGLGRSPGEGNSYSLHYSNICEYSNLKNCFYSYLPQMVKNLPAVQEAQIQSLDLEDPLEKGMATHSSILAWRIPWTEEPSRLWSMGSQRVGQYCDQH